MDIVRYKRSFAGSKWRSFIPVIAQATIWQLAPLPLSASTAHQYNHEDSLLISTLNVVRRKIDSWNSAFDSNPPSQIDIEDGRYPAKFRRILTRIFQYRCRVSYTAYRNKPGTILQSMKQVLSHSSCLGVPPKYTIQNIKPLPSKSTRSIPTPFPTSPTTNVGTPLPLQWLDSFSTLR